MCILYIFLKEKINMENKDILENRTNFLIIKDNNLIKLYSFNL